MYMEAFKEAHVMEAVRGLRNVLVSKGARLVPLGEMVQAITVNTKAKKVIGESAGGERVSGIWGLASLEPRGLASLRRVGCGAQTWTAGCACAASRTRATRPRWLTWTSGSSAPSSATSRASTTQTSIRSSAPLRWAKTAHSSASRRRSPLCGRPPGNCPRHHRAGRSACCCLLQRLLGCRAFSKQEAERHGLQPYYKSNLGSRMVLPGGGEFEDGYEIKWVSMRNVILDESGPAVEELTRFNQVRSPPRSSTSAHSGKAGPKRSGVPQIRDEPQTLLSAGSCGSKKAERGGARQ